MLSDDGLRDAIRARKSPEDPGDYTEFLALGAWLSRGGKCVDEVDEGTFKAWRKGFTELRAMSSGSRRRASLESRYLTTILKRKEQFERLLLDEFSERRRAIPVPESVFGEGVDRLSETLAAGPHPGDSSEIISLERAKGFGRTVLIITGASTWELILKRDDESSLGMIELLFVDRHGVEQSYRICTEESDVSINPMELEVIDPDIQEMRIGILDYEKAEEAP